MHARDIPSDMPTLLVLPWSDPVIDQVGYDPRTVYVERFWLGILGPSATWLLRHLVDGLDQAHEGYDLDLDACATALGLGRRPGANGVFPRTLARCCQFGATRFEDPATLFVRRRMPPLTRRQVARLPEALRADHARWVDKPPAAAAHEMRERARQLALSLVELGEDGAGTERQLHRWRFHPALASEATAWALDRHADPPGGTAA
ncbi:MAG TPA: hypothetical protein VF015_02550 [Acidimicrobiales bacterium]